MHFYLPSNIVSQNSFNIFFIFWLSSLPSFSSSGKRHTARWIDWSHSLPTSLRRDPECKHASQVRGHFTFRDRAKKWHGLWHRWHSSNANQMSSSGDEANEFIEVDQMDQVKRSVKKRERKREIKTDSCIARCGHIVIQLMISRNASWHEVWMSISRTHRRAFVIRLVCDACQDYLMLLSLLLSFLLIFFTSFCVLFKSDITCNILRGYNFRYIK